MGELGSPDLAFIAVYIARLESLDVKFLAFLCMRTLWGLNHGASQGCYADIQKLGLLGWCTLLT
jgi:hypothetical protein